VILAYRGTEPTNVINWLTDIDVDPVTFTLPGRRPTAPGAVVHAGFVRNVDTTWSEIREALDEAAHGRRIDGDGVVEHEMQALFVTGHSLGAAMAAIAGVWLAKGAFIDQLRGVYTFGQPMIGSPECASYCESVIGDRLFRHVYADDVVPHLPPKGVVGKFEHFGREWRAKDGGYWMRSRNKSKQAQHAISDSILLPSIEAIGEMLGRRFPLRYSWYDHSPVFYMRACEVR
jgi:hypothetical protein